MRPVLADHARTRNAAKRGGGHPWWNSKSSWTTPMKRPPTLSHWTTHLKTIAAFDERKARTSELRYFGGRAANYMEPDLFSEQFPLLGVSPASDR